MTALLLALGLGFVLGCCAGRIPSTWRWCRRRRDIYKLPPARAVRAVRLIAENGKVYESEGGYLTRRQAS